MRRQVAVRVHTSLDQVPHREFEDELGRLWTVWEVVPRSIERRREGGVAPPREEERREISGPRMVVAPELRAGWLAFESRGDKRRYAPAPPEWATFTDAQLRDYLARAKRVGRPKRLIE